METEFYVAVLLFRATHDGQAGDVLFEESFTLLTASGEEEARVKALALGTNREHSYRNENGELITWKLDRVVDVCLAVDDEITDGAELYSRHFRDYDAYWNFEPLLGGRPL